MSNSQVFPVVVAPNLYVNGFVPTYATTTTVSISAGTARDSNNVMDLVLLATDSALNTAGYVTAPLTLNVAVTGANGIDTGAVAANKLYQVFIIGSSSNQKPIACVATLSTASAPTMPKGYDSYRLVGYFATGGSATVLKFYVTGDKNTRVLTYDSGILVLNAGNQTTYTAVVLTTAVPVVDNTLVTFYTAYTPATAGNIFTTQGAASTADYSRLYGQVAAVLISDMRVILSQLVSSVPEINYKVSNGSDSVTLYVAAFEFFL